MPPGVYNVKVEHPGFRAVSSTNVQVQVQQSVRLDLTLQVGQVSETVEVSASAALLQSENATVGSVVENREIVEQARRLSATEAVALQVFVHPRVDTLQRFLYVLNRIRYAETKITLSELAKCGARQSSDTCVLEKSNG